MMFYLLDGWSQVWPRNDSVSLVVYWEFRQFMRKGEWNLSWKGVDEPGRDWVRCFGNE